jgi:hypothetical protein
MREIKIRFNDAHHKMLSMLAKVKEIEIEELLEQYVIVMLKKNTHDYEKLYAEYKRKA